MWTTIDKVRVWWFAFRVVFTLFRWSTIFTLRLLCTIILCYPPCWIIMISPTYTLLGFLLLKFGCILEVENSMSDLAVSLATLNLVHQISSIWS